MSEASPINPGTCPSRDALLAFIRQDLAPVAVQTIRTHLLSCATCRELFDVLNESGPTVTGVVANGEFLVANPEPENALPRVELPTGSLPLPNNTPAVLSAQDLRIPAADDALHPAQIGHYQISDRLGRGGMGVVYRARHVRLKRWVAVKLLPPARVANPLCVARFHREMEVIARLDHQNIVRATDAGEADGLHYLVMEFVDGLDLGRVVKRYGPLPVAEACEIIRQAAIGLQYAHENGLVHRDIKPNNLMLSKLGQVKILDLGLALLRGDQEAETLTGEGHVMGTADYMAPEQWETSHTVDIRADIYSLGCTLYTLLTGGPPFGGLEYQSLRHKMAAHVTKPPPPVTNARSDIPAHVVTLLDRMLAKEPADRPEQPSDVARLLGSITTGANLTSLSDAVLRLADPRDDLVRNPSSEADASTRAQLNRTIATVRRPRRRIVLATALLGLIVLGTVAGITQFWPKTADKGAAAERDAHPSDPNPITAAPPSTNQRVFKRAEWYDLLDQPPTEFVWWDPAGSSNWSFNEKARTLTVNCLATAFLSLGRTDAERYKFQVRLRQGVWTGGFGLFFGAHPTGNAQEFKVQVLEFRANVGPKSNQFGLYRLDGGIQFQPPKAPSVRSAGIAWAKLPPPEAREYYIEIQVQKPGLTEVTWDGQRTQGITTEVNSRFSQADYQGQFGIFCQSGAVTIQSARIMITE